MKNIFIFFAIFIAIISAEEQQSAIQQLYSRGNKEFSAKVYQVCIGFSMNYVGKFAVFNAFMYLNARLNKFQ